MKVCTVLRYFSWENKIDEVMKFTVKVKRTQKLNVNVCVKFGLFFKDYFSSRNKRAKCEG
jgi:hypothetical protein